MRKTKDTDYIRDQLAHWTWENRATYDLELEDLVYIFNYGQGKTADRVGRLYRAIKGFIKYETN